MSYICGITFSKWIIQSAAAAMDSAQSHQKNSMFGLEVTVAFQFILDFKMQTYVFLKIYLHLDFFQLH